MSRAEKVILALLVPTNAGSSRPALM